MVLIRYTFNENGRSIIKELELDIVSIKTARTTKSFDQPKIIINYDKTFDGVDPLLIVNALKVREDQ